MDDMELCSQVGDEEEETTEDWLEGHMEEVMNFGDQFDEDTDWRDQCATE